VGPLSTANTATTTVDGTAAARAANGGDAAGTLVAADHGAAATETQVAMHASPLASALSARCRSLPPPSPPRPLRLR
jgi:hypothetical protein